MSWLSFEDCHRTLWKCGARSQQRICLVSGYNTATQDLHGAFLFQILYFTFVVHESITFLGRSRGHVTTIAGGLWIRVQRQSCRCAAMEPFSAVLQISPAWLHFSRKPMVPACFPCEWFSNWLSPLLSRGEGRMGPAPRWVQK